LQSCDAFARIHHSGLRANRPRAHFGDGAVGDERNSRK
jgi:hypothetical protein